MTFRGPPRNLAFRCRSPRNDQARRGGSRTALPLHAVPDQPVRAFKPIAWPQEIKHQQRPCYTTFAPSSNTPFFKVHRVIFKDIHENHSSRTRPNTPIKAYPPRADIRPAPTTRRGSGRRFSRALSPCSTSAPRIEVLVMEPVLRWPAVSLPNRPNCSRLR